uniref:DUF3597 domain-containing protein n=1 Tax=Isoptericola sp. BMS4 TaxID=2527875 RepID=UPI0014208772
MTTLPTTTGDTTSRRSLLRVAGLTGLVTAGAAVSGAVGGPGAVAAPLPAARGAASSSVDVAATVAELVARKAKKLADGALAQLLGHAEAGDGAARLVRYDAGSTAEPNG